MKLTIATCQLPTGCDIAKNLSYVIKQMRQAKRGGADVAHFSETCLAGYAGIELGSYRDYDWAKLDAAHQCVLEQAKALRLWTIIGSVHRLTGAHKPHNSLYIINDRGRLVDRYDKMFCTGGDLKHYSPGNHLPVFTIKGVRCGTQICHDFRYQEVYRVYKRKNVQLMFHAYHNGHASAADAKRRRDYIGKHIALNRADNLWGVIVPPTMQAYAANNHFWISANNTGSSGSAWPSFFVRADGVITGKLRRGVAGVLISTLDTEAACHDAAHFRDNAIKGVLHSGKLVKDKRSDARQAL